MRDEKLILATTGRGVSGGTTGAVEGDMNTTQITLQGFVLSALESAGLTVVRLGVGLCYCGKPVACNHEAHE